MSVHHQIMNHHQGTFSDQFGSFFNVLPPTTISNNPFQQSSNISTDLKLFAQMTDPSKLRVKIHDHHLSYLTHDETRTKLELRFKIERLISEYLSMVPHSQKFNLTAIGDCLSKSIQKNNFDPQKAIVAFEAIEKYATNLLNLPWRHEYRTIFGYSGFFHRIIDGTLVNYQPVFGLLGYAYDAKNDIYKLVEIPIDPDKVSQVSLECLVAIVECRIMLTIDEQLKSNRLQVTWNDIHSVRSDYVCNAESAVKLISDLMRTGKLIDLDLPDYSVKQFNKLDLLSPCGLNGQTTGENLAQLDRSVPPRGKYLESNLDLIDFIDTDRHQYNNHAQDAYIPHSDSKQNSYSQTAKVAKFIHSDPVPNVSSSKQNEFYPKLNESSSHPVPSYRAKKVDENIPPLRQKENKYSDIDLVLISEINQFEKNITSAATAASSNTNNAFPMKVTVNESRVGEKPSPVQIVKLYPKNASHSSCLCDRSYSEKNFDDTATNSSVTSKQNITSNQNKKFSLDSWTCKYCTYNNQKHSDVCEMCHRSRTQGNESTPLVSGGRECNACTLVNDKDAKFCKVCQTSLADSPTYI